MPFLKFGFLFVVLARIAMSMRRLDHGSFETFVHKGHTFAVRVWKSKQGIHGVTFRMDIPDKLRFVLRREGWFDRVAKVLGLVTEWQTGDRRFDERIFILSEDVAFTRALQRDKELRALCGDMLTSHQGARIECRKGRLYLGFRAKNIDTEFARFLADRFDSELDSLRRLRDALQNIRASLWTQERDPSLTRKAWLVGISLVLGALGVAAFLFDIGPDRYQVVREAIPRLATGITIVVTLTLIGATFVWLRSTPHTHGVLLDILLAAAPGCWAVANVSATFYNQRFDQSEVRAVPVQALSTHKRKAKGQPKYTVRITGWPDSRGQREMRISQADYGWIKPGSCITALWHRGRLGDGWISGYQKGCPEMTVE